MSNALLALLYLAVAAEFITETLRQGLPVLQRLPAQWIAAAIGVLICCLTDQGLLAAAGDGFIRCPWADYLLTGLLISRGSGVIHDFIDAFTGLGRRLLRRI